MLERRYQANLKLFEARGAKPLAEWHVGAGKVGRRTAPGDVGYDGYAYELEDESPATRVSCPRPGAAPMNLRHRRLVLELWADPTKSFGVELTVRESGGGARTLTLSRDCMVPEMTHGSPKAKLPLIVDPLASAVATTATLEPGWRLVDLDLKTVVPMAFDGAIYSRLDAIAVFGTCFLRCVEVRTEPPPPFTVKRAVPLAPCFSAVGGLRNSTSAAIGRQGAAGGEGDDDDDDGEEYEGDADPHAFVTREERAAAAARAELAALEAAKAAARASHLASLRERVRRPAAVSEAAQGFIPAGEAPAAPEAPAGRPQGPRLAAAVRKLGALQALAKAPARPRRTNDPRAHRTDGALGVDASVYRREQTAGGKVVSDAAAGTQRAVASAQALCKELRRGTVGAQAALTSLPIGASGAKLLSFTLMGERATRLKDLSLSGSRIDDRGAEHLGRALRTNYALTRLAPQVLCAP